MSEKLKSTYHHKLAEGDLGRRQALARIGLGVTFAYVAPTLLTLSRAWAQTAGSDGDDDADDGGTDASGPTGGDSDDTDDSDDTEEESSDGPSPCGGAGQPACG